MTWSDTFWKVVSGAVLVGIVYVLVRPQSNAATGITAVSDALSNVVRMAVGGS